MLSANYKCMLATSQGVTAQELCSPQQKADKKLIFHAYTYFESSPVSTIAIYSPSADSDAIVLSVSLLNNYK